MAKQMANKMVGVIIALVIGGILIGYLLPVGIGAVNSPTNETLTQDVGSTYGIASGQINTTVTSVTDGTDATVELEHVEDGTTESNTVNVGSTTEYSLPGGDVNVTVSEANSGTPGNATVTYEYSEYGWSDGAKSLYGLMPLFLVLVPLVVVVGWAMRSM
jgi:hypothetical protein